MKVSNNFKLFLFRTLIVCYFLSSKKFFVIEIEALNGTRLKLNWSSYKRSCSIALFVYCLRKIGLTQGKITKSRIKDFILDFKSKIKAVFSKIGNGIAVEVANHIQSIYLRTEFVGQQVSLVNQERNNSRNYQTSNDRPVIGFVYFFAFIGQANLLSVNINVLQALDKQAILALLCFLPLQFVFKKALLSLHY